MKKSFTEMSPKPVYPPPGQDDSSAAIPREHNLVVAWWIAVVAAIVFIAGTVLLWPDPYGEILRFVADGLVVTFEITIVSMTFALILGLFAGLGRTSRTPWVNILASFYVEVIRGIPLLAQLFWIYYAFSRFVRLGPNVSAVLGLTICYGAYIAETFRAGIQSIPKGQMEAARALGLSRTQAMRYIIIPQAIRVVLPPVGNEFIAMLKDSSLVSVLAIADLLRRGREYASRTFNYFETYTFVALVYLLVTLIFSRVVFYIEQGMSRQDKDSPVTLMHRLSGVVVDFVVLDLVGLVVYGLLQALVLLVPDLLDLMGPVFYRLLQAQNLLTPDLMELVGPVVYGFFRALVLLAVDLLVWRVLAIVMGLLTLAYVLFFWITSGRTPGMMAVGVRLLDERGRSPSWGALLLRLVAAILPLPGFSLLWGLRGGLPLHDRMAKTRVVRET